MLDGKPGVEGRQTSDEVVLERLDGTFGGVGAVDVGWSELDGEGWGRYVPEDRWRQLVVAYVEVWGEASTREEEMDGVHDAAPFRGVA